MRAFYIQAINISSRVVGDDDAFGSTVFASLMFVYSAVVVLCGQAWDHHKVMPPFPSDQRQAHDRMLLLQFDDPLCLQAHSA